ncbi:partial Aspartyl/glutamyl-tRNA(Asn/Gln) amidotransferase subunit B, partial [Rhodocyclaceae bacterium]
SFRFLQQAIEYEARWQVETLEDGGRIVQSTVLFDPATGETRAMRSKEEAHDYRYFPDPDLLPLEISAAWIGEVEAGMPELPEAMKARFEADYGLSPYDAAALTASRETAGYFEQAAGQGHAKLCANWVMGELAARLNREEKEIAAAPVGPLQLAGLVARIADSTLSGKLAKDVFEALWNGEGKDADAIIEAKGLKQISDAGALEKIIDAVLAANPKSVEEFRAGKEKAFNALVGQAMKATRGKANPQQVNELLKKKLAG